VVLRGSYSCGVSSKAMTIFPDAKEYYCGVSSKAMIIFPDAKEYYLMCSSDQIPNFERIFHKS
jgi:hypothetical protein